MDEKDKKSVNLKSDNSINSNINYAKDSHGMIERSASFSTLVGSTHPNNKFLSRKYCNSVGADLNEKTRKESEAYMTPLKPIRKSLRNVRTSQSFVIDSPGKRKLSPESSNLNFQKDGSGKRTTRD